MGAPPPMGRVTTMTTYLGDSVYAELDGERIILTTNNGYPDDPRNRIVLDPDVWMALHEWLAAENRKESLP